MASVFFILLSVAVAEHKNMFNYPKWIGSCYLLICLGFFIKEIYG